MSAEGRPRAFAGLAPRLVVAQALVLVAGATTAWVVASVVGPGIFHEHLREAGVEHTSAEAAHVEEAFGSALIIALGVALLMSVLIAMAVTGFFMRRVQRSTAAVAASARELAQGHYGARVPSPGLGAEFDELTKTVNALAQRLGDVEATRRRILTDLAHEMRTPLATIEAHLEAVEDGVRPLDEDTLAVIRTGTQRLRRLAEDVGAVTRAEEGGLESRLVPAPVSELLDAAAAGARDRYRAKRVDLSVEATTRAVVMADRERMEQVLANLLDNALRHTPSGGHVRLSARHPDARWVEIDVADNGEGIAPEHLAHIFERFYRADPARSQGPGGTGIGLTISRALVEAHGGGLSATSAGAGRGATFTIRLPASG